jgi:hypothetical protein
VDVGPDGTLFRAYDAVEFLETGSWQRLRTIIATGDGGVYGLYGPRGSGKSWLMRRAITEATAAGGPGSGFPAQAGTSRPRFSRCWRTPWSARSKVCGRCPRTRSRSGSPRRGARRRLEGVSCGLVHGRGAIRRAESVRHPRPLGLAQFQALARRSRRGLAALSDPAVRRRSRARRDPAVGRPRCR